MTSKGYLFYLNTAEVIICLASQSLSITLFSYMSYSFYFKRKSQKTLRVSSSMFVYINFNIFFAFSAAPYFLYSLVGRNPDTKLYNPHILFWLGMFAMSYASTLTVPVLFITLDRCFAIKFPLQYNDRRRTWLFRSSCLIILFVYLSGLYFCLIELPLDLSKARFCESAACLLDKYKAKYHLQLKLWTSALNLVCACYFFFLLKKKQLSNIVSKFGSSVI
uniref:G-protein coupled receptors family 1 profile domain-containing protein n=1 Tax=Ditylenchus dipsaci TaxID=166011 RepID=A0A915CTH2_9BILA